MLVQILDAQAAPHFVTWQGLDQINDNSGALGAGAVGVAAAPQQVIAANTTTPGTAGCRCGWLFQNTSQAPMLLLELVAGEITSSWIIAPGAFFPPCGYPVTTAEIQVQGTSQSSVGDSYAAREFCNSASE
jgi:hypothetical protein